MSNSNLISDELAKKCRLCLQPAPELESFFDIFFEDLSLAQIFKNISSFEIQEDDKLPKNICTACRSTIVSFNNMISVFQDTEMILKGEIDDDDDDKTSLNDETKTEEDLFEEQVDNDEIKSETEVKRRTNLVYDNTLSPNGEYRYINSCKYICECGDIFLYKIGFRHHMQFRHNILLDDNDLSKYSEQIQLKIPTGISSNVEYVAPKLSINRNKLECRVCSEIFKTKSEVKLHENIHKTYICEECGSAFLKRAYLQDHMLKHSTDRKYKCKICNKAFKHRHTLSVHKKTHDDIKGFICEVCGASFRARATLYTHTLLKHTDVKNFPCPNCNLRFNLKSSRDKHFIRKHTFNREKNFVCNICGVAYLNKTTLTRHMSDKHLGKAKHFPCTICENKVYVMKKGLKMHMLKKHGISDE